MMPTECPVYQDINEAMEQAQSFARAMRKLRKSMRACASCEHYDDCPVIRNFRTAIHMVIEEITQKWDLRV
jgi:recombinational DNA repair protein RecR